MRRDLKYLERVTRFPMSNEPKQEKIAGARIRVRDLRVRDLRIESGLRCLEVQRSCYDLGAARPRPPAHPHARAHPLAVLAFSPATFGVR